MPAGGEGAPLSERMSRGASCNRKVVIPCPYGVQDMVTATHTMSACDGRGDPDRAIKDRRNTR